MTKKTKAASIIAILVTVTAIVALAIRHSITHPNIDTETIKNTYQEKSNKLKDAILPTIDESDYHIDSIDGYAVIMSCANENFGATTKVGTGDIQHNIGGLYMVAKFHNQLTEQGLPQTNTKISAKGSQTS